MIWLQEHPQPESLGIDDYNGVLGEVGSAGRCGVGAAFCMFSLVIPAETCLLLNGLVVVRWEEALWLLEEMVELGLMPDKTSFLHGIEACTNDGMVDEVRNDV